MAKHSKELTRNDALLQYTLHLADSSLIMGHRLSELAAHGPTLEQDIAVSNIALDLIGQSRNFYQYAAQIAGNGATEDTLAYFRNAEQFKNLLLTEQPNGDWAHTTLKVFFLSTFQFLLYQKLMSSADTQLAAIAEKSLKEVTYHLRWSSEWILRLGDGTDESHTRMQKAINELYRYTGEMFELQDYERILLTESISIDPDPIHLEWNTKVQDIIIEATLSLPLSVKQEFGGKCGKHTKHISLILEEMQELQRALPGCEW